MNDEETRAYSAALDELFRLRLLVAMYADHTEADLTYRTYPKSRRPIVEERVKGLRAAARGETSGVLAGKDGNRLKRSLQDAGGNPTLTRWQWEEEVNATIVRRNA